MTKQDIIERLVKEADVPKTVAAKALGSVLGSITDALRKGDKVTLVGFGTFGVAKRAARKGRNPQTGKEIKIAARKVPKFSAGAKLKEAVNSGKKK